LYNWDIANNKPHGTPPTRAERRYKMTTTNRKKFEIGKSYGAYFYPELSDTACLCYILTVVKRTEKTLWFTITHSDGTTYSDYEGITKRKIQDYHNDFEQVSIHQGYTDFYATDELDNNRKRA
jgi:hypothetical protein